jgi:hypothetical protein
MKRHSANEIVASLREVEALIARGWPIASAVRAVSVTTVTFYRWRKKYDGLKDGQVEWLVELQAENARLRKTVADLMLDKRILSEILKEFLFSSARRRVIVDRVRAALNVSERRACQVLGQHRSTQRKIPKSSNNSVTYTQPSSAHCE